MTRASRPKVASTLKTNVIRLTGTMRWGLGSSEKASATSDPDVQYVQNYPGANEAYAGQPDYEDPNNVPCPAHTTERKLLTRIDLHVIPFLVLLYWLAFLDRYDLKMEDASERS